MSPEQVRGNKVDARSDLYSLGITLYEILTGQLPIKGNSQYEIMDGHLRQQPRPPREMNPTLPPDLSDLVMHAMEKDPATRIASAQEFLRGLEGVQLEKTITLPAGAERYTAPFNSPTVSPTMQTMPRFSAGGPGSSSVTSTHGSTPSPALARASATGVKTDSSSVTGFAPEVIDQIAKELAHYVGPIARVLVKKAAKRSNSIRDIYEAVALEIDSMPDRQKFLAHKPRS
jgi:serine/threonine-protein kinase